MMDLSKYNTQNYDLSGLVPDWTYDNLTEARRAYVDQIIEHAETHNIDLNDMMFSRQQLRAISLSFKDNDDVPNWIVKDHDRRAMQGVYIIPEVVEKSSGESPLVEMTLVIDDEDIGDLMSQHSDDEDEEVFVLEPEMIESL